jgi:phosphoribosylformimino-5-aminoimidazole carboxamide ribotide isomerase
MTFTVYPAIDLRQGRVVRLTQGRADAETVYGEDPVAIARDFESQGATWLHVVNLDGAFGEATRNMEVLGQICEAVSIPVQFGGGLRGSGEIEAALGAGASRVILGTIALRKPALVKMLAPGLGDRLAVGIDARHGMVAVEGWVETSDVGARELAQRMMEAGVKRFIYTDIGRDGMLTGPDLEGALALQNLGAAVIASGGVGDIAHVQQARQMGVEGLIVGKALYEGRFTVRQALSS